jgi:hypothetical protein
MQRCFGDLEKDMYTCIQMGVDLAPGQQVDATPRPQPEPTTESCGGAVPRIGLPRTGSWEVLGEEDFEPVRLVGRL